MLMFEQYNQYYTQCDREDFLKCDILMMNYDDKVSILSILNTFKFNVTNKSSFVIEFSDVEYNRKSNKVSSGKIYMSDDEYYYVYNGRYYKCDQLEGLEKFIKDLHDKVI